MVDMTADRADMAAVPEEAREWAAMEWVVTDLLITRRWAVAGETAAAGTWADGATDRLPAEAAAAVYCQ